MSIPNSSTGWLLYFSPKTMTRWFYLDGHSLKTLQIGDNTNEGCLEVADILQIRSKTTEAYFAENSFEIEMYNGSKLPFGCGGPEEQKRWLTAFQIAKARRLISISSYIEHTNESNLQSVNDIVNFSNQFRRQVWLIHLSNFCLPFYLPTATIWR